MRRQQEQQRRRRSAKRALAGAAAAVAALAAMPVAPARAVVQDYNRARGSDGYQATHPGNGFYQATGTFDGRQFQPTPTGDPGAAGEFFFAGSDGGFVLDVRAPLGQGATWDQSANLAAGDNGGYMHMDFFQTGTAGYPPPLDGNGQPVSPPYNTLGNFWFGGAGNDAGPLPAVDAGNPDYSQILAYVDVLAPAGEKFEFRIESDYTFQGNGIKFVGTGTGGWQTIGGTLASGTTFGSFDTFDPNLAMLVAFGTPGADTNEMSWDNGGAFGSTPAILRWDNLTLTTAQAAWTASGGGNWSTNSNWSSAAPSGRNAVAIFGASAAPQTVTLDSPVIGDADDVAYQNTYYVGGLVFDSAAAYTIAGNEPLIIDTTAANGVDLAGRNGSIDVLAGHHTIAAPLRLNRTTNVNVVAGGSLTVSGDQTAQVGAGLIKQGAGSLEMKHLRGASLTIHGGAMKITASGGTAAGVSNVGTLSIAAASTLDLTDNKLITNTPAGTATGGVYADGSVQRYVQTAYQESAWSGPGLTTSTDDAKTGLTTLAVLTGEQYGSDTFMGQSIAPTSTIVMYTYGGDTNLDGKLDADDYGTIDFNVLLPQAVDGYYNGDFNYDGIVNADDYGVIDFNILAQTTPFPTGDASVAAGGVTAVPEPGALSLLAVGAAGVLRRGRRGRRN